VSFATITLCVASGIFFIIVVVVVVVYFVIDSVRKVLDTPTYKFQRQIFELNFKGKVDKECEAWFRH
jgi:hypothetical protein